MSTLSTDSGFCVFDSSDAEPSGYIDSEYSRTHQTHSTSMLPPPPSQSDEDQLLVFGYGCKLYRDDEKAKWIDEEKHLIPWMGDDSVLVDRYDGRGLLTDLRGKGHSTEPQIFDFGIDEDITSEPEIGKLCDEERYRDLHGGVDELTFHELEFRRLQSAVSGVVPDSNNYSSVGYNYEYSAPSKEEEDEASSLITESTNPVIGPKHKRVDELPFVPPPGLAMPPDIVMPTKMKVHAIIEKTAKFIATHGTQMEIILKTKQTNNKQFNFLYYDDTLNPYYKHLLTLIKDNVYKPADEFNLGQDADEENDFSTNVSDGSTSPDDDGAGYLHPSLLKRHEPMASPFSLFKPATPADSAYFMLVSKFKQMHGIPSSETSSPSPNPNPFSHEEACPRGTHGYGYQEGSTVHDHNGYQSGLTGGPNQMTTQATVVKSKPKTDEQVVIEKMATYVIKNGTAFESVAASKGDARFKFLDPSHPHHWYYLNCKRRFSAEVNAVVASGTPVGYNTENQINEKTDNAANSASEYSTSSTPGSPLIKPPTPNHANALSRMATLPPELINKIEQLRRKTLENKLLKEQQQQETIAEKKPVIKFSSSLANVALGVVPSTPSSENSVVSSTALAPDDMNEVSSTENVKTQPAYICSTVHPESLSLDSFDKTATEPEPIVEVKTEPATLIFNHESAPEHTKEQNDLPDESEENEQLRLKQERRRRAALFLQSLQKSKSEPSNAADSSIHEESILTNSSKTPATGADTVSTIEFTSLKDVVISSVDDIALSKSKEGSPTTSSEPKLSNGNSPESSTRFQTDAPEPVQENDVGSSKKKRRRSRSKSHDSLEKKSGHKSRKRSRHSKENNGEDSPSASKNHHRSSKSSKKKKKHRKSSKSKSHKKSKSKHRDK